MDIDAKIHAFLPVKNGGVGLHSAKQHSSAAFIASNIHSHNAIDKILSPQVTRRSLHNAFTLLQNHTGNASFMSEELLPSNSDQHSLSCDINAFKAKILLDRASPRDSARLLSLSLPHAGDFLDATPSLSLGLHLDTSIWSGNGVPTRHPSPESRRMQGHHIRPTTRHMRRPCTALPRRQWAQEQLLLLLLLLLF